MIQSDPYSNIGSLMLLIDREAVSRNSHLKSLIQKHFTEGLQLNKIEKCSAAQKNRVVIHLEDAELRVLPTELSSYLNLGWKEGISEKHRLASSRAHKGKPSANKGKKGLLKANKTSFQKGREPWNKGLKGVQQSTRKGETAATNPEIARMAELRRGQKRTPEQREHIRQGKVNQQPLSPEKLQIKLSKAYITKKRNQSFNTSEPEERFYEELKEMNRFKTIYRRYKEDRYPFYCDFYIQEDDLFIELNLHWTHGGRPYDPNDPDCQKQLALWQEKAKTSKFYQQAIETWTVRDVKKLDTARRNNLNYKTIY